jgi:hypothetical protein
MRRSKSAALALLLLASTSVASAATFTCQFESPSRFVPKLLHFSPGQGGAWGDWAIEEPAIKALFSTPMKARAGSAMAGDFPAALAWRRPSLRTPAGANLAAVAYEMTLAPTGAAHLLAAPDGAARKTRADGLCKLVF